MRHVLALGLCGVVALGAVASCSGQATHRPDQELVCEAGHGCGVAFCACQDDVLLFTSLCEGDVCTSTEEICSRRCAERGGTKANAGHAEGELAAPLCGQLCQRLRASGCETGCEPLFDACAAPDPTCAPGVVGLFECMAQEAVLGCDAGAITISGCSPDLGFCAPSSAAQDG